MSSKMQFQVFYGEYNVMYEPNGVDLSVFKRTSSGIDKPLEMSFGFICKWLQRGFGMHGRLRMGTRTYRPIAEVRLYLQPLTVESATGA